MAKGMREIKRQIKSTQNMKQITKAMEMIAAARLRKAQEAALASRPYADKMKEVVSNIAAGSSHVKHPMLKVREVKKTAYFVITSDRGLAGGYNANLLRTLVQTIRSKHASTNDYMLFVIGRKGRDFFRKREMPIAGELTGLSDDPKFADIKPLMNAAVTKFEDGGCDELILVYNQFINAISQKPVEVKLLPLTDIEKSGQAVSYEYEPSPEGVLNVLLPKYTETIIFSSLLEAKASEFGAKMTAMGSASKNATEMIKKYTLVYNRARQAAITQEISEIVAGANAQG
jgi:F-type H+-transporting ATPase subunit gamma